MSPTSILIEKFKVWRKERGVSLRQAQVMLDMSNPYLSNLETGKVKEMGYDKAMRMAKLIGIRDDQSEILVLLDRLQELVQRHS